MTVTTCKTSFFLLMILLLWLKQIIKVLNNNLVFGLYTEVVELVVMKICGLNVHLNYTVIIVDSYSNRIYKQNWENMEEFRIDPKQRAKDPNKNI